MNIQNNRLNAVWLLLILFRTACVPIVSPHTTGPSTAKSCVNVWTPYYSSENNYLGVVNGEPCLNAFRLIITFVEPVQSIELSFSGASQSYVLQAYDENRTELGSQTQRAEFNNGDGTLFTISFNSDATDIKSVQFGGPLGGDRIVIAVREISFSKGGVDFPYDFDAFPDGTVIAGDSQDANGRQWKSLIGDEFTAWGFMVTTDLDEG
jgi:hypothetical protein